MGVTYFKRYGMECDLTAAPVSTCELPECYEFVAWRDSLLDAHATTKYRSFCFELDANVFPCLGDRDGCYRLMREIVRKPGFLPAATWLLRKTASSPTLPEGAAFGSAFGGGQPTAEFCGTVQGILDSDGAGAIQNLGVAPHHRGQGLGAQLLLQALDGFRAEGLRRAVLEVTAQNAGAVRLYEKLGFRKFKTVYKAVEVAYA